MHLRWYMSRSFSTSNSKEVASTLFGHDPRCERLSSDLWRDGALVGSEQAVLGFHLSAAFCDVFKALHRQHVVDPRIHSDLVHHRDSCFLCSAISSLLLFSSPVSS